MTSSTLSKKSLHEESLEQRGFIFSKYSGCGNDFILLDNREGSFPSDNKEFISHLCNRRLGIGADGIILLDPSKIGDYKMRIFNSDGGEAEMCGNGLRCLGRFLKEKNLEILSETLPVSIEVTGQIYPLVLHEDDTVSVEIPSPNHLEWDLDFSLEKNRWHADFIDTGVPHIVFEVEDVSEQNLTVLGPFFRNHDYFFPKGANVNFYSKNGQPFELSIRTYERGVEGETLACGTGGAACAVAAWKKYGTCFFRVNFLSKESVDYTIKEKNGAINSILMRGPATFVFQGSFCFP